jgi:DNA-binding transcriptional LysR family regulator
VNVVCEPSMQLIAQVQANDLDLAIITHTPEHGLGEIIREEKLLWVSSARQAIHCARPVPLALGRDTCIWRRSALAGLERANIPWRVLYTSWSSTAVGAMIQSGLAVSVLAESALRNGMRVLGPEEGFPLLPPVKIALLRNPRARTHLAQALAQQIVQSLDNRAEGERVKAAE